LFHSILTSNAAVVILRIINPSCYMYVTRCQQRNHLDFSITLSPFSTRLRLCFRSSIRAFSTSAV